MCSGWGPLPAHWAITATPNPGIVYQISLRQRPVWYTGCMTVLLWSANLFTVLFLALISYLYLQGWAKLRGKWPDLYTRVRLLMFAASILLALMALSYPLPWLGRHFLSIRSMQKVLLCMLIPPLFWASIPVHAILSTLPTSWCRGWIRRVARPSLLPRIIAQWPNPGVVWLLYVSAFLLWHEPAFVDWSIERPWTGSLFAWILLGTSVIYWGYVVHTGPRLIGTLSGWSAFLYLVAVEIPNMFAGVTVAFAQYPIYEHYVDFGALRSAPFVDLFFMIGVTDQMLSGVMTWIAGSIIYVSTIIIVLNRQFRSEGGLPPILRFTEFGDERTIAPGLEYRVRQHHE